MVTYLLLVKSFPPLLYVYARLKSPGEMQTRGSGGRNLAVKEGVHSDGTFHSVPRRLLSSNSITAQINQEGTLLASFIGSLPTGVVCKGS